MVNISQIPAHIGIILDGNRRWASAKGLSSLAGHRQGLQNVKAVARAAFKKGVKILTVFAFSTENWNRDQKEVAYLMNIFSRFMRDEVGALARLGARIKFLGRLTDFSPKIRTAMEDVEKQTASGTSGQLNVCLSYGGRDEIVRAVKKIVSGGTDAAQITDALLSQNLDTAGLPDPDLIIRTSGEKRMSGFLAWQAVYSELYFTPRLWPEFNVEDLDDALGEYAKRQRRFGANG